MLSPQLVCELKSFYPQNQIADYLLTKFTAKGVDENIRGWAIQNFDAAKYREQVKTIPRLRAPSLTYPGFVPGRYREYSEPWFHTHRSVRGASFATHARMRHPRYRNFYLPERNDLFVGFRTCRR